MTVVFAMFLVWPAAHVTETTSSYLCTHAASYNVVTMRQYTETQMQAALVNTSLSTGWQVRAVADVAMMATGFDVPLACNGGPGGCAIKSLQTMNAHKRLCGNDWPPFAFTMVGVVRIVNVAQLVASVHRANLVGDFAELGVWRGGTCIFTRRLFDMLEPNNIRRVHVFDAFEALPGYGSKQSYLENAVSSVRSNFEAFSAMSPYVQFHVGLFQATTKAFRTAYRLDSTRLAILRIDGNFYDSYQDALYALYDYVPVGGYVIFDDVISHTAVMQCWTDFKADQQLPETLTRIDKHSAYFQKMVDIKVKQSLKRPNRDANL